MEADIYLQLANYAVINQLKVIEELTFIRDRLKLLTENNNWEEEVNQKIKSAESNQNLGLEIIKEARTRRPGDAKKAWDSTVVYLNRAQEDLDVTFDYLDEVIKRLE
jgi:hypothetical protein